VSTVLADLAARRKAQTMIFDATDRAALAAAGLAIGNRRDDDRFVGVLRRGRAVVVECGHRHANRDVSTKANGVSASDCARELVQAALRPSVVEYRVEQIGAAWQRLGRGFAAPASVIEAAKAKAPADVAEYRAKVAEVAALLAGAGAATEQLDLFAGRSA
jgi:hypothetical protein